MDYLRSGGKNTVIQCASPKEQYLSHKEEIQTVVLSVLENGWYILGKEVKEFEKEKGAKVMLKEIPNPSQYGVPVIEGKKITKVIEKPKVPPSNYAVMGVYMYNSQVFDIICSLKPSSRGELEVSDVNDWYAKRGELSYEIFNGWWGDAGVSVDVLLEVNKYVAKRKKENPNHWSGGDARKNSGKDNS